MRRIQVSEAIDTRIERRGTEEVVLMIFTADEDARLTPDQATVRQILRLQPGTPEWRLSFGTVPRRDNEIAMLTRSMAEIFLEIAATLEAPAGHTESGRATPQPARPARPTAWDEPLVRIHSGAEKPGDAYAAVRYRNHWFWVDDNDLKSKSVFTFVLLLLSLAETGATPQAPVITVPAG